MSKKSYRNGYRYCSRCRAYHKIESRRCPTCGTPLRTSPKKKKYDIKYIDPIGLLDEGGALIEPAQSPIEAHQEDAFTRIHKV